jgi:predicted transcriptional regulator
VAYSFELPEELRERVVTLASDLSSLALEAREAFDESRENWRDSDEGVAVDGWIEEIDELAQQLENVPEVPK